MPLTDDNGGVSNYISSLVGSSQSKGYKTSSWIKGAKCIRDAGTDDQYNCNHQLTSIQIITIGVWQ